MKSMLTKRILIAVLVLLIIGLVWFVVSRKKYHPSHFVPSSDVTALPTASPSPQTAQYKTIRAQDVADVPAQYRYSVAVPQSWEIEIVKQAEAINFYDPNAAGANNLEKSQIFIRYFTANQFLTLSTVDILERSEQTIHGRPAVRYVIQKKASVPNFANQPTWRNEKHVVTDIRVSDTNPSIFYVVAKNPDLSEEAYQHFFDSIKLGN
jgi:hypothetical protein